ncbi:MAG: energy-coupling factor transporter transmembrane component T [Nitrospirota bacterium]
MFSELKIVLYVTFIVSLFLIQDLSAYILILIVLSILLLRIPLASLKRGWLPISLFLAFTFMSNVFFSHGKILYSIGSIVITEEGLRLATVRTLRIFFMVAGAKILTATTPLDVMVETLRKTLSPLEKIGMPVVGDFFSVMGLTLKCFPRLKDYLGENYRNHKNNTESKGFWGRVNIVSSFLLPIFIQSLQSPEMFFQEREETQDKTT